MAVQTYEVLFLVDPNRASADLESVVREVNAPIEKHGGTIVDTRPWSEPKLAYPIKNFRKGMYILTYYKIETQQIAAMEQEWRLNDTILRYLVVKLHPRIAEEIFKALRGEIPMPGTFEGDGRDRDGRDGREGRDRDRDRGDRDRGDRDRGDRWERGERGERGDRQGAAIS